MSGGGANLQSGISCRNQDRPNSPVIDGNFTAMASARVTGAPSSANSNPNQSNYGLSDISDVGDEGGDENAIETDEDLN